MTIVDDKLFLEKNYNSKTSYFSQNPDKKLLKVVSDNTGNVIEESYENNAKIVLEYDNNNNIISEEWYLENTNTVSYCEKHKFEFFENGCLKTRYFAKFDGPQTNKNWQLIEDFDEEGNITCIKKDFEGDGNIDFVEEFNHILASRTKTLYNSNGKIINVQQYEYDFDGGLMSVSYDKDGDGTIEYKKEYK